MYYIGENLFYEENYWASAVVKQATADSSSFSNYYYKNNQISFLHKQLEFKYNVFFSSAGSAQRTLQEKAEEFLDEIGAPNIPEDAFDQYNTLLNEYASSDLNLNVSKPITGQVKSKVNHSFIIVKKLHDFDQSLMELYKKFNLIHIKILDEMYLFIHMFDSDEQVLNQCKIDAQETLLELNKKNNYAVINRVGKNKFFFKQVMPGRVAASTLKTVACCETN